MEAHTLRKIGNDPFTSLFSLINFRRLELGRAKRAVCEKFMQTPESFKKTVIFFYYYHYYIFLGLELEYKGPKWILDVLGFRNCVRELGLSIKLTDAYTWNLTIAWIWFSIWWLEAWNILVLESFRYWMEYIYFVVNFQLTWNKQIILVLYKDSECGLYIPRMKIEGISCCKVRTRMRIQWFPFCVLSFDDGVN